MSIPLGKTYSPQGTETSQAFAMLKSGLVTGILVLWLRMQDGHIRQGQVGEQDTKVQVGCSGCPPPLLAVWPVGVTVASWPLQLSCEPQHLASLWNFKQLVLWWGHCLSSAC